MFNAVVCTHSFYLRSTWFVYNCISYPKITMYDFFFEKILTTVIQITTQDTYLSYRASENRAIMRFHALVFSLSKSSSMIVVPAVLSAPITALK